MNPGIAEYLHSQTIHPTPLRTDCFKNITPHTVGYDLLHQSLTSIFNQYEPEPEPGCGTAWRHLVSVFYTDNGKNVSTGSLGDFQYLGLVVLFAIYGKPFRNFESFNPFP